MKIEQFLENTILGTIEFITHSYRPYTISSLMTFFKTPPEKKTVQLSDVDQTHFPLEIAACKEFLKDKSPLEYQPLIEPLIQLVNVEDDDNDSMKQALHELLSIALLIARTFQYATDDFELPNLNSVTAIFNPILNQLYLKEMAIRDALVAFSNKMHDWSFSLKIRFQQFTHLHEQWSLLEKTKLPVLLIDLTAALDQLRTDYYEVLILQLKREVPELFEEPHAPLPDEKREVIFDLFQTLDKRNLCHLSAIYGERELFRSLVMFCSEDEMRLVDGFGQTAINYATKNEDQKDFLNRHFKHLLFAPEKNPRTPQETLQIVRAILNSDAKADDQSVLQSFTLQFTQPVKLVEKMKWIRDLDRGVWGLAGLLLSIEEVSNIVEEFHKIDRKAHPLRFMLGEFLGYPEKTQLQSDKEHAFVITKAEQITLASQCISADDADKPVIVCVNEIEELFKDLTKKIQLLTLNPAVKDHHSELLSIQALITLNQACISGFLMQFLLSEVRAQLDKNNPIKNELFWRTIWLENKATAAKCYADETLNDAIAAVRHLVVTSLKTIDLTDDVFESCIKNLEPLIYEKDPDMILPLLRQMESSRCIVDDTKKKWRKNWVNAELVMKSIPVAERKERHFGPIVAKYQLIAWLKDRKDDFNNKVGARVIEYSYNAITAKSFEVAKPFINEVEELMNTEQYWIAIRDAFKIYISGTQHYIRESDFKDFSPLAIKEEEHLSALGMKA